MKVTDETQALARKILAYWELFNHHDQHSWVAEEPDDLEIKKVRVGDREVKVCNSNMCAAGTAIFLSSKKKEFIKAVRKYESDDDFWENRGGELLGLDEDEANSLFYTMNTDKVKEAMRAIADGDEDGFYDLIM